MVGVEGQVSFEEFVEMCGVPAWRARQDQVFSKDGDGDGNYTTRTYVGDDGYTYTEYTYY